MFDQPDRKLFETKVHARTFIIAYMHIQIVIRSHSKLFGIRGHAKGDSYKQVESSPVQTAMK